jgi:hypothetical protein
MNRQDLLLILVIIVIVLQGFILYCCCTNSNQKKAAPQQSGSSTNKGKESKDYVTGIDPEVARAHIENLSATCSGVYYQIEDIQNYAAKYQKIIDNKPAPAGYEYRVGHYVAKDDEGKFYFLVAPVLLNLKDSSVRDAYSYPDEFNTQFKIDGKYHFYFNEGQKWP